VAGDGNGGGKSVRVCKINQQAPRNNLKEGNKNLPTGSGALRPEPVVVVIGGPLLLLEETGHGAARRVASLFGLLWAGVWATGNGQRATGNGQRATGNGQRATGNGQRATGNGQRQRATGNGQRATGNG